MKLSRRQKIIATIVYADLFDYPLTKDEVIRWAVGGVGEGTWDSSAFEKKISRGNEYLILPGRGRLISFRNTRRDVAVEKWRRISSVAARFRVVPTLLLVGVTGGLAVENAKRNDDIDLFFVARKHTLWLTRALVTLMAEAMGVRRRPADQKVADKVCLNMFMSEDALALPREEQDFFAAHEVLQMKPLWEREHVYQRFLHANRWVQYFLPNAWKVVRNNKKEKKPVWFLFIFQILEPVAKVLQLGYMKKKRTNEVIRLGMIRFHPRDARHWVREKYEVALKRWDIPLDNIFYRR